MDHNTSFLRYFKKVIFSHNVGKFWGTLGNWQKFSDLFDDGIFLAFFNIGDFVKEIFQSIFSFFVSKSKGIGTGLYNIFSSQFIINPLI